MGNQAKVHTGDADGPGRGVKRKAGAASRRLRWLALCLLALGVPGAAAQAQAPAPAAGKITRLVPVDYVVRARKNLEAKKDMDVFWADMIKTERGGRVRVQLEDGSILNVGSESSLVIERHDARNQQTDLELLYGRFRANVVKVAAPGGGFKVRTRAAVAGVVGTEEYMEASEILTTVIALGGGQVAVTSTDPRFPDPILLNPGEAATLVVGVRPGPKRLATTDELTRAVRDTEADPVAALTSAQSTPGRTFETTITGRGLNTATGISFSIAGIQAQITGEITATQIPVTITVSADVPLGTYLLTIDRPEGPARATLVITSAEAAAVTAGAPAAAMEPPSSVSLSGIRGVKFALDASATRTPAGTQIVSYQWRVLNTSLASNEVTFTVNTSLLQPGNYTVQLVVVNDRGQTATQQYPLTVETGIQPAEIVRELATAYESLQPAQFLKNFDEQKFRNYSGFAAAIEDSFRNKLETVRVFQRPVNCAVLEEQDQAVCQADFELQFTLKSQPIELLDAQGNPVPPGGSPPPGSMLGKRILTGSERTTVRYERGDAGWKIVDYSAVVSCPGSTSTSGVNVGSCLFALGSATAPSFQIINLQVFSTDLPLGGAVNGTFEVVPVGGFNGSINFSVQSQSSNPSVPVQVTVQFMPNPSGPMGRVDFTVFAPTQVPMGFAGAQPFTLVITGRDTSGGINVSANVGLVLQPDFSIQVNPASSSSAPLAVTHNSTLDLSVQVIPGLGFTGSVLIDFPNLPAGFQAMSGSVAAGATGSFPVQVTSAAAPGPAALTVRGRFGTGVVRTASVFVDVTSDFTLNVTPASTSATPIQVNANRSVLLSVQVVPISGFAGTALVDFTNLPAGFQPTPASANVAAGAAANFDVFVAATVPIGPAQFNVRGTVGTSVQTVTVFVQVLTAIIPINTLSTTQAQTTGESASSATPAAPAGTAPRIVEVQPAGGAPAAYTPVTIIGESLAGIRTVLSDSPQLTATVEAGGSDTRIQLRVFVKPAAPAGEHTLLLVGPNGSTPVAFVVESEEPNAEEDRLSARSRRKARRARAAVSPEDGEGPAGQPLRPAGEDAAGARPARRPMARDAEVEEGLVAARRAPDAPDLPDLVVRPEDITMTPANPKPGETVTFRVRVSNAGARPVDDATLDFFIEGAAVRQREQVSLAPQASQTFEFEWQAAGSGRLLPRVVLDPENRIQERSRANNTASLGPFELADASAAVSGRAAARRERARVRLAAGGCVGFRLASGTETECDRGADFELRASTDATTIEIHAEGVGNLGAASFEQLAPVAGAALASAQPVQPGSTYLVETRQGVALVRVTLVRRLGAGPPPALRGPRLGDAQREPRAETAAVMVWLEWKLLPPQ